MAVVDELLFVMSADGTDKVAKELAEVEKQISSTEKEIEKLEKAIKRSGKTSDKAALAMKTRMVNSLKSQQRELTRTKARIDLYRRSLDGLGSAGDKAFEILKRGALGATVGVGGLVAMFDEFTSSALETKTAAAAAGVTIDQLQRLEFAAKRSGLRAGELRLGLRQMAARLKEVRDAGGDERSGVGLAFTQLGISFKEFDQLNPHQQMLRLADAANKMGNSAHRNANFARIFGEEAGAKFADLLGKGSEAIVELGTEIEAVGGLLKPEQVIKADEMEHEILLLKASMTTLKNEVLGDLLPIFKPLTQQMLEWLKTNRVAVREDLGKFFRKMAAVARELAVEAKPAFAVIQRLFDVFMSLPPGTIARIVSNMAKFSVVAKTVAPIKDLAKGLMEFKKTASAASQGLSATSALVTAAGGPWIALAAAIGVATLALIEFMNHSQSKKLEADIKAVQSQGRFQRFKSAAEVNKGPNLAINLSKAQIREQRLRSVGLIRQEQDRLGRLEGQGGGSAERQRKASQNIIDTENAKLRRLAQAEQQQRRNRVAADEERRREDEAKKKEDERLKMQKRKELRGGARASAPADTRVLSDEELAKLIAEAAKSGRNLDELLKNRKIKGNAPPVLTVIIHNNSTNVNVGDFIVDAGSSTDPNGIAKAAMGQFREMLGEELMRNARRGDAKVI